MDRPATNLTVANLPLIKVIRRPSSVPRATIHVRCRDGPARAGHAAPLHRVHPWGVGDPSLASQFMQRSLNARTDGRTAVGRYPVGQDSLRRLSLCV